MPNFRPTGRLVGIAALAASTALSGPIGAYAQDNARLHSSTVRVAQADAPLPPTEQQPAEPAAAAEPAAPAEPVVEQPAPKVEEPAPAPEPKVDEPPAPAPAPKAEAPAPVAEPKLESPAPAADKPVEAKPADAPTAPAAKSAPAPAAETPPSAAEGPAETTAAPAADAPKKRSGKKQRGSKAPAEIAPPAEKPASEAPPAPADDPAAAEPTTKPAAETKPKATPAPAASEAPAPVPETAIPGQPTGQEAAPDAAPDTKTPAAKSPAPNAAPAGDAATPPAGATPPSGEVPGTPPAAPNGDQASPAGQAGPAAGNTDAPAPAAGDGTPTEAKATPSEAPSARPVETPKPVAADVQTEAVPQGGVAASDARVQQLAAPVDVPSITAEQGKRIKAPAAPAAAPGATDNSTTTTNNTTVNNTTINNTVVAAPQLPPGAKVVERVGDRDILSIVGAGVAGAVAGGAAAYFIRGNDDDRIANKAEDRYYEQLRDDRRRQTIVRPNGVKVVTITNRYGDVIQRSKILRNGKEVVLFYDPYSADADRPDYYTDPGADLPPLRLEIPEDQYIVDPSQPDEDLYYRTMVAPPVETVERIYSLDEVRRSQRIRDKVRRIDLSTINFDFGSDAIAQAQVPNLQALAEAIAKIINENPDETFLIEGHTDAVGKEIANLALSDRRAEAVASALTQYFDVPPENLITQGYGESDLKVNTQTENRENRRVTVRRITALVKPVTTARR